MGKIPCKNCGKKVKSHAKFCKKCGTKVADAAEGAAEEAVEAVDATVVETNVDAKYEGTRVKDSDPKQLGPSCEHCYLPLSPPWAKFCVGCGKGTNKATIMARKREHDEKAKATADRGKADEEEVQAFADKVKTVATDDARESNSRPSTLLSAEARRAQSVNRTRPSVAMNLQRQVSLQEEEDLEEKAEEELKRRNKLQEQLEEKEDRVERMRYRQEASPWMVSKRQVHFCKNLERDVLLLKIQVLRLNIEIVDKQAMERDFRGMLRDKAGELEEYKAKALKPWLLTKEDKATMATLKSDMGELDADIERMVEEAETRQERLLELEEEFAGKGVKSAAAKSAETRAKFLKKKLKQEAKQMAQFRDLWTISPQKVDVMDMQTVERSLKKTKQELAAIPKEHLQVLKVKHKDSACKECTMPLSRHTRFCLNCGAKQSKSSSKAKRFCQHDGCKQTLKPGVMFCIKCGTQQDPDLEIDSTRGTGEQHAGLEDLSEDEGDEGEEDDLYVPIVIDNGSHTFKAGFSISDIPSLVIPSVIALKHKPTPKPMGGKVWDIDWGAHLFGAQLADSGQDPMDMFAVDKAWGTDIGDWQHLETMWVYLLERMQVDLSDIESPIMVTEPVQAPLRLRQEMLEILFESFAFPAAHVAKAAVLSCYSYGDSTGLVLDVGEESCQIVPVVDGYVIEHAVRRVKHFGGAVATSLIFPRVFEQCKGLSEWEARNISHVVKQKLCFVPETPEVYNENFDDEEVYDECTVERPKGDLELGLSTEMLDVGELFFQPKRILDDMDASVLSLPGMVAEVIKQCSVDVRAELMGNILLCGGTTKLANFAERLKLGLMDLLPHARAHINVRSDRYRHYSAWTGGAVLANIESFQQRWTSKWEYDEEGGRHADDEPYEEDDDEEEG